MCVVDALESAFGRDDEGVPVRFASVWEKYERIQTLKAIDRLSSRTDVSAFLLDILSTEVVFNNIMADRSSDLGAEMSKYEMHLVTEVPMEQLRASLEKRPEWKFLVYGSTDGRFFRTPFGRTNVHGIFRQNTGGLMNHMAHMEYDAEEGAVRSISDKGGYRLCENERYDVFIFVPRDTLVDKE